MSEPTASQGPLGSKSLEWINLALVGLGLLILAAAQKLDWLLAFALGGIFSGINLRLWRVIVAGLTGQKKLNRGLLAFLVVLKLGVLFGGLALVLIFLKPPLLPFLLGLSTLVMAIVVQGVWGMFKN